MSIEEAQAPDCDHYWSYRLYNGKSLRSCMLCHEPDWDDVKDPLPMWQVSSRPWPWFVPEMYIRAKSRREARRKTREFHWDMLRIRSFLLFTRRDRFR